MKTTLNEESTREVIVRLREANASFAHDYPGEPERRQPVHTVYGGAHLFRAEMSRKLGDGALAALDEYAPDFATFGRALGLPGHERLPIDPSETAELSAALARDASAMWLTSPHAWLAHTIRERVVAKLRREPVEDFRIDFEDGFGTREEGEEDLAATRAASEVARGMADGSLPPFIGIRIKSLAEETRARAVRTLDLFLTELVSATGGKLPSGFVVTLPKVTIVAHVTAMVDLLEALERGLGLEDGALRFEIMVETTQALIDADGRAALPLMVRAARGRCVGAHFGTYDYTAGCDITAQYQSMTHPAASFARHMMQVSFARTGIFTSDGATNVMPVPVYRQRGEKPLTEPEKAANRASVHAAWKLQFAQVHDSLVRGFHQGWDLHPAQLPVRYAAIHAFFLGGLDASAERLSSFVARAARASLVGSVFDDAATGQGLLNYFIRAVTSGAITEDEVLERTGLSLGELRLRSFAKILEGRAALARSRPTAG